ncbi:MAG: hypothetical protein A2069_05035 [Planctomycetes bacterium GWB2_41_19]|nr:MAG: hypothetical protein A2069_05035 [Planctomycetes bacterium GWB2_41_19]
MRVSGWYKIPPPHPVPLQRGIKGEEMGCKITQGKTQPPESPFIKGECVGLTYWTCDNSKDVRD